MRYFIIVKIRGSVQTDAFILLIRLLLEHKFVMIKFVILGYLGQHCAQIS